MSAINSPFWRELAANQAFSKSNDKELLLILIPVKLEMMPFSK